MQQETNRILDCLERLDKAVGKTSHRDFVAVSRPSTATRDERQRLVWQMSVDIGLPFDFRARSVPLAPGVAAEIDLYATSIVVDVRTCPGLHYYPWNYFSAICRELTRMYLKCHRLDCEDELLVDVCAVYLGFGGYLMNGMIAREGLLDRGDFASPPLPCQLTSGYLSTSQLRFVFRYVCQMRKIHPCVAYHGVGDLNYAYDVLEDPYAQRLTAEFQGAVAKDRILKAEFDEMKLQKGAWLKTAYLPHDGRGKFVADCDAEALPAEERAGFRSEREDSNDDMFILIVLAAVFVLLWCIFGQYCFPEVKP